MRKQMEISEIDGRLNEEYDRKLQEQLNVSSFFESDYLLATVCNSIIKSKN